ncbi:MAG: RNA 2',3'-cyclic phosphodiesterase [Bryobacteraceae bacterium]
MRLFTAIDPSPEVLLRLERLISVLRPEAFVKWSPLDNLHVTIKFIGAWPESRMDELNDALTSLLPRDPFEVEVKGLGWFPNERAPRILWAGVQGGDPFRKLARETDECLAQLGILKDDRRFTPHLTLARIKNPVPLDRLRQRIRETQSTLFGNFSVAQFALFRSDPGSNASLYRKVGAYGFESALAAP